MLSTLDLQLLTPLDWRLLRETRLEALRESPHAFASTYARESGWSEREWRRVCDAAKWIVAREAEQVIGLAKSVNEAGQTRTRHIESIWVAPMHRRHGVLRALLRALAEIEQKVGVAELLLWVLEDNDNAQRAYQAVGFERTGERQFLPAVDRFERRLRLEIDSYWTDAPTRAAFESTTASQN